VMHVEEGEGALAETLSGRPVVCCTLHSQVAPVCGGLGDGVEIAYVHVAGGALPVSLSDTVRALRRRFRVRTIAAGACLDGDVQAVGVASALAHAATWSDAVVCSVGPGVVGTSSRWGHGGLAASETANAASALGGAPILAVRASEADERERHRGVSHHALAVFELCLGTVTAGWPAGRAAPEWLRPRDEVDASGWRDACAGLPLSHMSRGPDADPLFFEAAYAAGLVARSRLA
jgi:Protein of unknown function (DUF3866)